MIMIKLAPNGSLIADGGLLRTDQQVLCSALVHTYGVGAVACFLLYNLFFYTIVEHSSCGGGMQRVVGELSLSPNSGHEIPDSFAQNVDTYGFVDIPCLRCSLGHSRSILLQGVALASLRQKPHIFFKQVNNVAFLTRVTVRADNF